MIRITIIFYLLGLVVFYTAATFYVHAYNTWSYAYYTWQKASDFLFMLTIYKQPKDADIIYPILYLAGARLGWEIVAWLTGLQAINPVMVGTLFIILISICLFITIKDIIKWQKQK